MPTTKTSEPTLPLPGLEPNSVSSAMTVQLEAWLNDQVQLMEGMEGALSHWVKRQREASEATLRAVRRLSDCTDVVQAAAIYQEWLTGNVDRVLREMAAAREQGMRLMERGIVRPSAAAGAAENAAE